MTKNLPLIITLALFIGLPSHAQKMKPVFNGKNLSNWDIFIGTALTGFKELKEQATPEKTYSVVKQDGENLLRISGDVNASIATKKAYKNYHFRMEFKWGDKVYTTRNSGLLYHSVGNFGAGLDTWMSSIELQLMHGNIGDAYMMGDPYADIPVKKDGDKLVYTTKGDLLPFGNDQKGGKIARKSSDNEKAVDEWNVIDLYCIGQKSIHVVNGVKVMECQNTGLLVNGQTQPLSKGKIQIQSEGGELFIRKAEIRSIKSFPENL
ncbi:3-keto-disaccharide hydrolase [Sunxiuqinia sp. sy24]|uniref:3-keto-disaccharide hydrolase n=1 Tax=Sunxiuqinia sp. sy24 TaxID=3461495 RepID=UPI004045AA1D